MSDELRDANLALLIGLKRHLDEAARLRLIYDRLLGLAPSPPDQRAIREGRSRRSRRAAERVTEVPRAK